MTTPTVSDYVDVVTAVFDYVPDYEQIVLPVGNDDETRRHIEIFLTENLADGEDLDHLTIAKATSDPDVWVAQYRFKLIGEDRQIVFVRRTAEL